MLYANYHCCIPFYRNLHSDGKVEYLQTEEGQQVGRLAARRSIYQHQRDGQRAHRDQRTHVDVVCK